MQLLQLLFLLGAAVFSSQDHLPVCQPPTPPSSESHRETLMVFVLDTTIWKEDKKYHWYFLKRLACSVPVSPSIQTFAVDCSANNTNLVISKDTVYDSNALMSKLYDGYEKRKDDTDRCAHFETTVKALLATPYIKDHPNLHMIVPTLDPTCKLPDFATTRKVSIDFLDNKDGTRRFLTIGGEGIINADDSNSPTTLTQATDTLVKIMVNGNGQNPAAGLPSVESNAKPKLGLATILAIIGFALAGAFLIAAAVTFIATCTLSRTNRQLKKQIAVADKASEGASSSHNGSTVKGGKKVESDANAILPAPRVVYRLGMTYPEYKDYCYYTSDDRLEIPELLVKMALHQDPWGDPHAPPPPFPPPMHANY